MLFGEKMVMSVCFDNLKFCLQFLCPALGDRSHHQVLRKILQRRTNMFNSVIPEDGLCGYIEWWRTQKRSKKRNSICQCLCLS
jgi:hypothetical protein